MRFDYGETTSAAGDFVLTIGKYKGKALKNIHDLKYLRWLVIHLGGVVDVVTLVYHHPFALLGLLAVYLALGLVYLVYKYPGHVREKMGDELKKLPTFSQYCANEGVSENESVRGTYDAVFARDVDTCSLRYSPKNMMSTLVMWVTCWPVYLVDTIMGDWLYGSVTWLINDVVGAWLKQLWQREVERFKSGFKQQP